MYDVEHIARTLWLCAYADGIECGAIVGPRAVGGEDWDSVAPNAPSAAEEKARELATMIGVGWLAAMERDWILATGLDSERFGNCVALQALGHGVGLSDDVPVSMGYERPKLPLIEFSIWDCGELPDGVEWGTEEDLG